MSKPKDEINVDNIFKAVVKDVAIKFGRGDIDSRAALCCLSLPALSTRVLFQNEGIPLGRIIHLVGEEASFKSTFAVEVMRWHISNGGLGVVLDTESRPVEDIHRGILGNLDSSKYNLYPCSSLEEWETFLFRFVQHLKKEQISVPACCVVDSLMGCNSKETITKMYSEGFVTNRFALEAKSIADFLRTFAQELLGFPFTLCLVNHRKLRLNPTGYSNVPIKTSLGGNEPRFYASFELELKKKDVASHTLDGVTSYTVQLKTDKNTYGRERVALACSVKLYNDEAERLNILFDWHEATTKMLYDFSNIKPSFSSATVSAVRKICDIKKRRGGPKGDLFWCEQLGISAEDAMPPSALGRRLEENKEMLEKLYPLLGVRRRYIYNPEISWNDNMSAAMK